ncbi:YbfB/YjiJ family MFS transporter [Polynucleobacter sp. MWH-UH2A]|uniref:YbfB/YjiJ family MFS transporter n=1 Tax=Polynucleobacter sp. MWH-UH2A TaxID=1855617 RepID=UPI001BFE6ACE|nr:YbfB/YjiJ family MFS transporter [Polynucleobacter sp. MWH-UH2A]QWD63703.1 YbfB/YjiJ family MFS transporter [Polynucleobacter sp. MWH-UH2A]
MAHPSDASQPQPIATALALALGAAISLGLARFSYALLLPSMREDLGWSYMIAGSMNTANAGGYFIGALFCPWVFKKISAPKIFIASALLTSIFLGISGAVTDTTALFLLRLFAGIFSAFVFVGGGILAAQLANLHHRKSGLILGIYYGGTGIGIVLACLITPIAVDWSIHQKLNHIWQLGWWALALTGCLLTLFLAKPSLSIETAPSVRDSSQTTAISSYGKIVFAYFCFGMGYIGYMTFVIALLRQIGMSAQLINIFYAILGCCVMASSRLWARMLDVYKGGKSLFTLNGLLAIATLIPAIIDAWHSETGPLSPLSIGAIYFSGVIFGGCFLSAVASTTAFVKHNLPQSQWISGITVFTITFAIGQVIGPTLTGWISDHFGSLSMGLTLSSCILIVGSAVAYQQQPLAQKGKPHPTSL